MSKWIQNNFSGGQSQNKSEGIKNSCARLQSINIHDNSKRITVNSALSKISGSTVTDKIIKFVEYSTFVFAFGNTGKIYKITKSTNAVELVYTDANGAILDATYFYGYFVWTTAGKIGRCDATSSDWDSDANKDWQTLESSNYHNLYAVGNRCFVGNGQYLGSISNAFAWTNNSLDFEQDWTARGITLIKPLLLISVENNGRTKVLTWDFINADESWNDFPGFEEGAIDNFIEYKGIIYALNGDILTYVNGTLLSEIYEFPNSLVGSTVYNKHPYFSTPKGVYSYRRKNKDYNRVISLEYIFSTGTDITAAGAILGTSTDLYVAWENSGSFGIDAIDTSNKAAQGIVETLLISETIPLHPKRISYFFEPLPSGCSIQIKYKTEKETSFQPIKDQDGNTLTSSTEDAVEDYLNFNIGHLVKELQLQILLNSSGNTAPVFRGFNVELGV